MKSLVLDSAEKTAVAAIFDNDKLVCESFLNTGFTHSQTLLPMVDYCFKISKTQVSEIDQFVVTSGPGSFTGLRIGLATIKGLALGKLSGLSDQQNISPYICKAVSTLEGLAYNLIDFNGIIVPALDARCNQVYCSIFESKGNIITRLEKDEAIAINDLLDKLKKFNSDPIFLLGNGADLCYNSLKDNFNGNLNLVSDNLKYLKASSVFLASKNSQLVSPTDLLPTYLRLSQAQRQLLKKQDNII